MALIASTISSLSSLASINPNNLSMFLIPKFCCPSKVSSSSPSNTTKRPIPSCIYAPVPSRLKQLDQKTSIEYSRELDVKKVKNILIANQNYLLKSLEMINAIQGLGIDLHFLHEIDQILHMIYKEYTQFNGYYGRDLREVALCFRLLRQGGHYVKESIFENIIEKKGRFGGNLQNDVKGLIELYEASELGVEGEETLDSLREFAFNRLNELCSGRESHQELEIMRSLTQPRHKTLRRLTSKRFKSKIIIEGQEANESLQSLLRVAEIDSILSKSLIQEEISQTFIWDHDGLEKLPRYMKVCFEALDTITKEISTKVCNSHGWNPSDSLRKSWASLCKAFLVEAQWFHSGYLPNTKEYMKNGVMSSGVHLVMLHVYFLLGEELTREKVELMENKPMIVSSAASILRLWDDLGSAKDKNQDGFDGSYIECYLNEHKGSTLDEARTHVFQEISKAWKCLNKECLNPRPFSRSFSNACLNIARTVPMMYSYDDNQRLPGLDEYVKSHLTLSDV